jgi:hypothetical protein
MYEADLARAEKRANQNDRINQDEDRQTESSICLFFRNIKLDGWMIQTKIASSCLAVLVDMMIL